MNYQQFYQKISRPFRPYRKMIGLINKVFTYLFYVAYPICLIICFYKGCLLKGILVPFISFVLLTLFRNVVNKQRPYEKWNIKPIIKKKTKGHSLPSRHIFSSVMISMCYVMVLPVVGYILLFISILAACIRVIGGVHYPIDVIVGYLIGLICGGILIFI